MPYPGKALFCKRGITLTIAEYRGFVPLITRRRLLVLLAVGLLIREMLAPWTGHPWDLEVFARVGYYVANGTTPYTFLEPLQGITFAPYGNMTSVGYPPPWPLICSLWYSVYSFFNDLVGAPVFLYYSLLKQPQIIADVLCALLIYRIIGDEKKSLWALKFWLFNPLTIILCSVWGIFESFALLLTLFSLVSLVGMKEKVSGLVLGFSMALKIIPSIFAPILFLFSGRKAWFLSLLLVSSILPTFLPFLIFGWPLDGFFNAMGSQAVNARDTPAIGGITIFSVLGYLLGASPSLDLSQLLGVLNYLWLGAFAIFYIAALVLYFRKRSRFTLTSCAKSGPVYGSDAFGFLIRLLIIASLIFLLTRIWVNEAYALYLLAFMLIDLSIFHEGQKRWFLALWGLAFAFLITNNTMIVRFLTPSLPAAFYYDLYINNTPPPLWIRDALMMIEASAFYIVAAKVLHSYLRGTAPNPVPPKEPPPPSQRAPQNEVSISIGICAHNEEKNIRSLLENLLTKQPLKGKSLKEIIVVSSGSTDGTNGIIRSMMQTSDKIVLIEEERRTGKSNAQNIILNRAKGDLLILLSADTYPHPGSIDALADELSDGVGGAIANVVVSNPISGTVNRASHFIWALHNHTNSRLSSAGALSHLGGDMFAVKNGLVRSIPPSIINDDAYIGAIIKRNGHLIVKSERATVSILGPRTLNDFLAQRVRVLAGHRQLRGLDCSSSTFEGMLLTRPALCLGILVKTCSQVGAWSILCLPAILSVELLAHIKATVYANAEHLILWQPVTTTKERVLDADNCLG